MQCGFGMLEAGSVTARATQNILLKNLLDTSVSAIVWCTVGFGIAFDGGNPFIGVPGGGMGAANGSTFFLSYRMQADDAAGASSDGTTLGFNWAFWWFQFVSLPVPTTPCPPLCGRRPPPSRCRMLPTEPATCVVDSSRALCLRVRRRRRLLPPRRR